MNSGYVMVLIHGHIGAAHYRQSWSLYHTAFIISNRSEMPKQLAINKLTL